MSDDPLLTRLQDCLDAVNAAALHVIGHASTADRGPYRNALVELEAAWNALASAIDVQTQAAYGDIAAALLSRIGDELFYGVGASDDAIAAYEGALAMAPGHVISLKGIVAAYLQGSDRRPNRALVYAERLARIDPAHEGSVRYIRSLIAER